MAIVECTDCGAEYQYSIFEECPVCENCGGTDFEPSKRRTQV